VAFPDAATELDNFNRANENLSSGNWATFGNGVAGPMAIVTNEMKRGAAGNYCGSYWSAADFGPDVHVWVPLSYDMTTNGMPPYLGLWLRSPNAAAADVLGYSVTIATESSGKIAIVRNDSGSETVLANVTNQSGEWTGSSMRFGASIEGTVIKAWRYNGTTWSEELSYDTAPDGTKYSSAGDVGVDIFDTSAIVEMDSWNVGTLSSGTDYTGTVPGAAAGTASGPTPGVNARPFINISVS
jgi:hypothetical protein